MNRTIIVILLLISYHITFSQEGENEITLSYQGSSTVGNFIQDAQSEVTNIKFIIDTRPESSGGELAILEGRTDFAGIARIPSKEILSSGITSTLIGWDAIAIIVNKENPIKNITQSQLKQIYMGDITNWSDLGGPDLEINSYIVGTESATRKVCRSVILGVDDYKDCIEIRPDIDIITKVNQDIGGLGQISYSFVKDNDHVKAISVNGQTLTLTNKNYPITRPLYLLWWQGRKDVSSFVQWALSNEGQRLIMKRFIGIREASVTFEAETGTLMVYTKTTPIEDGGIYYYPHNGYDVLATDRSLVMHVVNHLSRNDENPAQIELPLGDYIIKTDLDGNEVHEYPINVTSSQLIKLYPERKESTFTYDNISTTSKKVLNSNVKDINSQKFDYFGDFRVRAEEDFNEEFNRFRARFRIRAGLYASLSSNFRMEIRMVSTGNPDDPNSTHVNLNDGFNQIKVAFDRAFIKYSSNKNPSLNWWLGKFSNPNTSSLIYSQVIWDADIQPEGTAFSFSKKYNNGTGNIEATNGFYLLSQFKSGSRRSWLYTLQLSNSYKLSPDWTVQLSNGLYFYNKIRGLNVLSFFLDSNDGNSFNEIVKVVDQDTTITNHYATNFHILNNFINLKSTIFNKPITFKLQWIHNLGAPGKNNGIIGGISYGELQGRKDWLFYYQINHIEKDALFTPFSQDDALIRSDALIHIASIAYKLNKKISLQFWGLFSKSLDSDFVNSRARIDLNVKI